jgi:hypothetical protein
MRLPQSSSQPLSLRVFSTIILTALSVMAPLCVRSSAQQLMFAPTYLKFGTVTAGQSENQLAVLTNAGRTAVKISAIGIGSSQFSVSGITLPAVLAAGASVTVTATFTPTASGFVSAKATFTSTASNPGVQLGLTGTGVTSQALTATPPVLSFGQTAVGASTTQSVVLTNSLTRKETLLALQLAGSNFSVSGPTFPLALSPGQSVTVAITFAPQSSGVTGGSLFVSGPALNVPLTGTGTTVGQLAISPAALAFGSVIIGETGTQTTVLSATGGDVTVSSAASSNSQFALSGATFPLTIPAGTSAQLSVVFAPQSAGASSAKLSFASNSSSTPAAEPAAGTGLAPQVSLGWSASASQVQGYNVYRGVSPGVYSKINSSIDPGTTYTDTTVTPGTTYYYAATAVSASGEESTYSAPVQIAVP